MIPFPSNRHHRSNSDCLEGKREHYQVCSVQGYSTPHFSSHVYCRQATACIKMPLGTVVDLGPGDIVLDEDPYPASERGIVAPLFSAHVYCGQTIAHLSYC